MLQTVICAVATVATIQPGISPAMDGENIHIVFDTPEGRDNRGPVILPFCGSVNTLAGLVELTFASPCGNVQYQLENLDDNTCLSGSVAGTGVAVIPFSCTTGQWRIILTLVSGDVYIGEFTL
jgi:hypothetical protein